MTSNASTTLSPVRVAIDIAKLTHQVLLELPNGRRRVMRVANTRSLILLSQDTGQYYLSLMGKWAAANTALGPWTLANAVPASFAAIVRKLMSKQPEERHQSCAELRGDLTRWTDPARVRADVPDAERASADHD